jgi:hypothetical protein
MTIMLQFELLAKDQGTRARRGRVTTPHGVIETPIFMPVGTHGALKAMTPAQVDEAGAQIILSCISSQGKAWLPKPAACIGSCIGRNRS